MTVTKKMTKKEMIKRKQALSHDIRNLRDDYSGVLREDIPVEITEEINSMMVELKGLREVLGND